MLLFIFSNLTLTTKFKKLAANSIPGVRIMQTPAELSSHGCSYSVRANEKYKDVLFSLVGTEDLFPKAIFKTHSLSRGKVNYIRLK